jgi:xanthine dehydrogenase accessory factor
MVNQSLSELTICIKGAGEMASGTACRLYLANFKRIVMLEVETPLAVRRKVSFSEAIYDNTQTVEGISALKIDQASEIEKAWAAKKIAVVSDPDWQTLKIIPFDVVIDAILAKKNLGTNMNEAPLVIGFGPGFTAGKDVHAVIETNRGHNLGRIFTQGTAEPNTGVPGKIGDYTSERVIRASTNGQFTSYKSIGDRVSAGEAVGEVAGQPIKTEIAGVLRGLIRNGTPVKTGLKLGDIDPRGKTENCTTISEKARAIGGSVLETILTKFN